MASAQCGGEVVTQLAFASPMNGTGRNPSAGCLDLNLRSGNHDHCLRYSHQDTIIAGALFIAAPRMHGRYAAVGQYRLDTVTATPGSYATVTAIVRDRRFLPGRAVSHLVQ
jgi:hypothetical protein